jgi:hypothetical protein
MPHTTTFLDHPPVNLMRYASIIELMPEGLRLRFVGTGIVLRSQEDFTGQYFEEHVDSVQRAQCRADIERVCRHPAGIRHDGVAETTKNRSVVFEAIYLPLAVDAGKPPRCITFSQLLDELEFGEHKIKFDWPQFPKWLDLGAGIPQGSACEAEKKSGSPAA